jgi:ABC-type cobalamin/Fe3+-siderophores transport systems, ATPase components
MATIELSEVKIGYTASRGLIKQIGPIINFEASKGELIALIGSNGIGKSTLLRTLIHLQSSLAGKLSFFGKSQSALSRDEFSTLISFVSTEPVRVTNLSVYQLVSLGRFPYTNWLGQITAPDKDIIEESLELVNLTKMKDLYIDEISDGERQRAMIARALAQNTPIILLDEPTAYLDITNKYSIIQLLLDLAHSKQKTIIFSTHELNIALSQVDKIWLMYNNGVKQGAPEDLILDNSFSDLFGNKLEFNWQSGTFKQFKIMNKSIALRCIQGNIHELIAKALDRIGFSVDNNSTQSIEVIKQENEYFFKVKGFAKDMELKSIYELCRFLRSS